MKKLYIIIIFLFTNYLLHAQTGTLTGMVLDASTKKPLDGVSVAADSVASTTTMESGAFSLPLKPGYYRVICTFIGYEKLVIDSCHIVASVNANLGNLEMKMKKRELDLIVVSSSRYEKKLQDEVVSLQVMKPSFIQNTNSTSMDEALNKMPGLNIIDGQANIRGGSGYAYGAGSRVLVLVDDLPALTADAGDVKWDFLPVENLEQVEIIKGASSTLYGSSALNGVINIRTAFPGTKPVTTFCFYEGLYGNPARKEIQWWDIKKPYYHGGYFFHSRRIGQFDLAFGANLFGEESFRKDEYTQRGRFNFNTRYRFKNIKGLSVGLNGNFQNNRSGALFIWANDTTGTYLPYGGALTDSTTSITEGNNSRMNLDPFITYFTRGGDKHALKGRYFLTVNRNSKNQSSTAKSYFGQYTFTKKLKFGLVLNVGLSSSYSDVVSELYGDHNGTNSAAYIQVEQKVKKLTLLGGVRYETFRLDTSYGNSDPVFRAGINYQIGEGTHIRASFGQGYRFPTIAEKYVRTNIGSLNVYPNLQVQPEDGWNTEIGIMQGFKISHWFGYADIAAFRTEYHNFMEFTFGQWGNIFKDPFYGIGFKSINIENAEITGAEFNLVGEGKILGIPVTLMFGFTHIEPIDIGKRAYVDSVENAALSMLQERRDSLELTTYLKYRYKNTIKADIDLTWRKFTIGGTCRYNSFMINIDPFFEGKDPFFPVAIIPGIAEYRKEHNKGDIIFDFRLSYQLSSIFKIAFICKNGLNTEYTERPALVEQPRSYTVQGVLRF